MTEETLNMESPIEKTQFDKTVKSAELMARVHYVDWQNSGLPRQAIISAVTMLLIRLIEDINLIDTDTGEEVRKATIDVLESIKKTKRIYVPKGGSKGVCT